MQPEADVSELVNRLTRHSEALGRHIAIIQQAFNQIQQESYANLRRVWHGETAEWFYSQWDRSMEGIERYLEGARQSKMLVDEHLESLRAADLPFGGGAGAGPSAAAGGRGKQLGIRFPVSANEERDLSSAQGFLRGERRRDGIPLMGEPGGSSFTRARLDIGGKSYVGKSEGKTEADIAKVPGIFPRAMAHAEAHAITQAKREGVTAKTATLYVDREPCKPFCQPALPKLARWLGVDKRRVMTPDGLFGEY